MGAMLVSVPIVAQTEQEAMDVALNFLKQRRGDVQLSLSPVRISEPASSMRVRDIAADGAADGGVYAFNAAEGGFCIVCSGGGRTLVAGYSDSGRIDPANLPEAMGYLLAGYHSGSMPTQPSYADAGHASRKVASVEPLIKTKWGQGAPFNGMCPSDGKQTAAAGCTPVALAQVLNYYHQDRKGGGSLYYAHVDSETEYTVDYSTTTYDWANMLDSYTADATAEQKGAVAKLILECGIACKADYGYNGTSAHNPYVALNKYYNYNCMYVTREHHENLGSMYDSHYYVSTEKWMDMIQTELAARRPIIYSASDMSGKTSVYWKPSSNHCFVIDGIDNHGFVHVNWGWAGVADGYYDLSVLDPGTQSFNYDQGYRCQHSMIIGIEPRQTDFREEICQPFVVFDWMNSRGNIVKVAADRNAGVDVQSSSSIAEVTSKNMMYYLMAGNTYEEKKWKFTTVLVKDGEIVKNLANGYYNEKVAGWPGYSRWNLCNGFGSVPADVPDGVYDIRLAYDDNGVMRLCPVPGQLVPTMEIVKGGTAMIIRGLEGEDLVRNLTIEDITPASDLFAGTNIYLNVKARGSSNSSYLQFRNMATGKVYGTSDSSPFSFHFEYDNTEAASVFMLTPKNVDNGFTMPAGRYKVVLPDDAKDITLAKDIYIDVAEKPDYPILDGLGWAYVTVFGGSWEHNDDWTYTKGYNRYELYRVQPILEYANKTAVPVDINVYMVNVDTGEERVVALLKDWTPDYPDRGFGITAYPLTGRFVFKCRYMTPDGERGTLAPDGFYQKPSIIYNIFDSEPQMKCYLSYWSKTNVGNSTADDGCYVANLKVGLSGTFEYYNTQHSVVKALMFDKATRTVLVDSLTDVNVDRNGALSECTLPLRLAKGAKYNVNLLFYPSDQGGMLYHFVLTDDERIAEFEIDDNEVTSGIASANSLQDVFREGETVAVYGVDGVIVKKLSYSPSMWADLASALPHGTFIVRSSDNTVKFKK